MIRHIELEVVRDIEAGGSSVHLTWVKCIGAQEAARDQAIADVLLSLSIVCHPAVGVGSFEFQTTTGPLAQDYLQGVVPGLRKRADVNGAAYVRVHDCVIGSARVPELHPAVYAETRRVTAGTCGRRKDRISFPDRGQVNSMVSDVGNR